MDNCTADYQTWEREKLIERVSRLEEQLRASNERFNILQAGRTSKSPSPKPRPWNPRVNREFNQERYSTRLIALKFAYLGQRYMGFEYHTGNKTRLTTIEEELWKALSKARLIFPSKRLDSDDEITFDDCDYSKCGRTDRGVSAFGQVIGIRVRSNRPRARDILRSGADDGIIDSVNGVDNLISPQNSGDGEANVSPDSTLEVQPTFDHIHDEIPYIQVLNRLLPPDIRVLAWCPTPPPDFSARFSCKERRYRYFFTQPAFNPTYGPEGLRLGPKTSNTQRREGWLDIEAMRDAAKRFEGLHDFRNFCKVDASKQIENFERRIFLSEIREVDAASLPASYISGADFTEFGQSTELSTATSNSTPKLYMFVLHGSAFLWHQVRHMVGILFLVGQGLEPPSIIDSLLNTNLHPAKPMYEMADDAPLVLWDCIFPDLQNTNREERQIESRPDALEWIYVGDKVPRGLKSTQKGNGKFGLGGVVDDGWKLWRQRKMNEVLAGMLLNVMAGQGSEAPMGGGESALRESSSQKVYYGGDESRPRGKYVPLLERPRMETVEVINGRFAAKKGAQAETVQEN